MGPQSQYRYAALSPSLDAFGRSRVGTPTTLFDSKQLFDNQSLFWDDQEVSGSSTTSTHSTARASTTIAVGATTAGNRTRQTFQRWNYQPGKSQLALLTGILDKSGGGTGITRRVGLFDDDNGLFFEDDEGTVKVVVRTSTSGSAVNTKVSQSAWNIDTMDGSGGYKNPSQVSIDWTKTQIFVIDFEWLGVGRVRFGLNVDGVTYYVHEFRNANNLAVVYMSTPNLPCRYEIDNDGTGAASEIEHICATVMSEGGVEDLGVIHYVSTAGTQVDMTTEDQLYAIKGIRLKSTHLGSVIKTLRVGVRRCRVGVAVRSDD